MLSYPSRVTTTLLHVTLLRIRSVLVNFSRFPFCISPFCRVKVFLRSIPSAVQMAFVTLNLQISKELRGTSDWYCYIFAASQKWKIIGCHPRQCYLDFFTKRMSESYLWWTVLRHSQATCNLTHHQSKKLCWYKMILKLFFQYSDFPTITLPVCRPTLKYI
jgi:hypothetical protein